ncbi:MAG: hypothetical protein HOC74_28415 [Gemmatimonadetes bacterium]|jgi:septal ring factor EnvC (AmiA/AmiB activator)|nr:hypothetical protein [Gemmatimonadota bacterium]
MIWMLMVISIAAVAYAISVVSEYTAFVREIQPRMARLQKESDNLKKVIQKESSEVGRLEASLSEDRDTIEDIHREIVSSQNEMKQLAVKEHELELAVYKQEFRMSRRKV